LNTPPSLFDHMDDKMKQETPPVTVVICTYNRSMLLSHCLRSLSEQSATPESYEVIVVDNNSTDSTQDIAMDFTRRFPNFKLIHEPEQGLSHARNRGWKEAEAPWVAYIDDDAKAMPGYIERLLFVIENYPFDCFGGVYLPWYEYGKPGWFRDEYASNLSVQDHTGVLNSGYASGGNFVIRRTILEEFEGFHADLGMRPDKIAYAEEALLQMQLRNAGYTIGFDPQLIVEHLVSREKLSPWWFVRSAYARSRDWETAQDIKPRLGRLLLTIRSLLHDLLYNLISKTPSLKRSDYFIQNWIVDVLAPIASKMGSMSGLMR